MVEDTSAPAHVSIREYTPADRERTVELLRELQDFERDIEARLKPPEQLGGEHLDNLLKKIERCGGAVLIAESHGKTCGYAAYMTHIPNDDEDEIDYTYAYVSILAVTAGMRNMGIGRLLLQHCEAGARAAGASVLRISVLSQNERAAGLYRSFGFSDRVTELEKPLT